MAALVLAACGGGSGAVAATVNGVDITVADVESLIDPGEEPTIPKSEFAQILGFEIQRQIIATAAEEELGIVIPDDEVAAEADALFEASNTEGVSREEFLATNRVTEELLQRAAFQQLLQIEVRETLAADVPEPAQEEIDTAVAAVEGLYCASHILVATQAEADAVLDRLGAGEEFADVAAEVSTDVGSGAAGGSLGCSAPDAYVAEFADALTGAETGVPTEPVQSEFGFHVILLQEPEDVVVEQLKAQTAGTFANEWFIDHITGAEVSVDDRWGTWETDPTPQVVPAAE
ncbi:MAG: peptidylprolyl isomerase [Acidimicrobiia bacterium]